MTKIFIDNEWVEFNYTTLYETRGYTTTRSRMLEVYDIFMNSIEGWNNSGYNWIQQDTTWYPENATPYYINQNRQKTVYRADQLEIYPVYYYMGEDVLYRTSEDFVSFYDLHDYDGYTLTPSEIYATEQGVPWSWYNSDENQYWDDRDGYKQWTSEPPLLYISLFGGNFTTSDDVLLSSVDGGGNLINRYNRPRQIFDLVGWEPGGLFVDKPRMMGICGVLTETSDSVVLVEVPKQLSVGRIEFIGSLAEGGIPDSGVVEEYVPAPTNYIDIVLGLRWDVDNGGWLAKSFGINDWWWSGILSQSDLSRLQAFGCDYCQTTDTSTAWAGLIGAVKYDDGFYYDLLELYDEIGEQPASMASGFYFAERTSTADRDYTGCLIIYARYGYTRPIKSYKVRITKKEEYIDLILGFRWDTSLNDWRSINFDYELEDNNWWGCFISTDDATKVSRYGVEVGSAGWLGDNGGLLYSDDFTFEVLEVYSELDQPVTSYDLSTFDIRSVSNSASSHMLSIFNTQRDATMLKFWKCRITRKVAPVLPTVTVDDTAYGLISGGTNINPGSSSDALRAWNGSAFQGQTIVRDSSCAYAFWKYSDGNGWTNPCGKFVVDWYIDPWYPDSEQICAKNSNAEAQPFYSAKVATCSSSDATLITVYNTSNDAYNAFKYNNGTTDYYYVLDGTQADWTDDLSSIGYSLTKSLPVVENVRCWLNKNQGEAANVSTSFTRVAYDSSSNRIPYSSSLLYCVFLLSTVTTLDGTFGVANSSGSVAIARSDGTNSATVYSVYYATCSDSTATIIDVYDSQNDVFKCFKYTQDGVDYYRVMEWQNTHPDWVTDLSSIGYGLTQFTEKTLYFNYKGDMITVIINREYRLWDLNTEGFMDYSSLYGIKSFNPSSGYGKLINVNGSMGFTYSGGYNSQNLISVTIAPLSRVFLNSRGAKTNTQMSYLSAYYLYINGSQIPYSSEIKLWNICDAEGTQSSSTFSLVNSGGLLALRCDSGDASICYCDVMGL